MQEFRVLAKESVPSLKRSRRPPGFGFQHVAIRSDGRVCVLHADRGAQPLTQRIATAWGVVPVLEDAGYKVDPANEKLYVVLPHVAPPTPDAPGSREAKKDATPPSILGKRKRPREMQKSPLEPTKRRKTVRLADVVARQLERGRPPLAVLRWVDKLMCTDSIHIDHSDIHP